jgi:protein tyrosine phosphatase
MEERERCYSFILSRTPHETHGGSNHGVRIYIYLYTIILQGHEYAKNSYIATQGPLQNTIFDFWLMVYQNSTDYQTPDVTHNTQKIVMLTNFIENNRQKCEKYFPLELHEESTFVCPEDTEETISFTIKNCGLVKKSGYTIRKLQVCYSKVSDSVVVYHYWFHNWADHKCPKDVNALLNLSLDVLKDSQHNFDVKNEESEELCKCDSPKTDSKFIFPPLEAQSAPCEVKVSVSTPLDFSVEHHCPPTVIHCSAGIGRTGCLIAILNGIKQLTNEQKVDVLGIVCNMRLNRGGMVQNSEQYELIHKVLCLFEQACLPTL